MTMPVADFIAKCRESIADVPDWQPVPNGAGNLRMLLHVLEQSEKALAEAKAGESYALQELAKLRHELVIYKRDTRTLTEAAIAERAAYSAWLKASPEASAEAQVDYHAARIHLHNVLDKKGTK